MLASRATRNTLAMYRIVLLKALQEIFVHDFFTLEQSDLSMLSQALHWGADLRIVCCTLSIYI